MIIIADFLLLAELKVSNNDEVDFDQIAEKLNKECGSLFEKTLSCVDAANLYSEGVLQIFDDKAALLAWRY